MRTISVELTEKEWGYLIAALSKHQHEMRANADGLQKFPELWEQTLEMCADMVKLMQKLSNAYSESCNA